jgi:hypothetical protein
MSERGPGDGGAPAPSPKWWVVVALGLAVLLGVAALQLLDDADDRQVPQRSAPPPKALVVRPPA